MRNTSGEGEGRGGKLGSKEEKDGGRRGRKLRKVKRKTRGGVVEGVEERGG